MLRPTTEAADEALEIAQTYRTIHSLISPIRPRELLHITLNGVGAYRKLPQDIVFGAEQIAATVRARPFDLVLDEVMSFRHQGKSQAFVICSRQEKRGADGPTPPDPGRLVPGWIALQPRRPPDAAHDAAL